MMTAEDFDLALRSALDRLGVTYPTGAGDKGQAMQTGTVRKWIDFTLKPEFILGFVIAVITAFWWIGGAALTQRDAIRDMQGKMQQTLEVLKNLQEQVNVNKKDADKSFPAIDALTRQMDLQNQSTQNLTESLKTFREAVADDSRNTNQTLQRLIEGAGHIDVDVAVLKNQVQQIRPGSPHGG